MNGFSWNPCVSEGTALNLGNAFLLGLSIFFLLLKLLLTNTRWHAVDLFR